LEHHQLPRYGSLSNLLERSFMNSLRIKLRIDFGEENAVGPGKIALLERMRDTGSLSQAARELKMSYRRAWQLLDSLNQSFAEPVVITSVGGKGGGGTTITPLGTTLVTTYRELERDITSQVTARFASLTGKVSHLRSGKRRSLTKSASRSKSAAAPPPPARRR
jgi:molybdate transport system regulatory protein